MHFRLTARDGNPVAGGVAHADTAVQHRSGPVPFRVTSQTAPRTGTGGSDLPVTWDIAGTTAPPLNAAQVAIRLSLDNGKTFPVVLAGSTANDGTETVTLPNVAASRARIKIEALGAPFFDLSHANLRIDFQAHGDG